MAASDAAIQRVRRNPEVEVERAVDVEGGERRPQPQ
jgi:hypothetical protein